MQNPLKEIDTKELELPETVFIRDIESKVFQSIVLQCLCASRWRGDVRGESLRFSLGR